MGNKHHLRLAEATGHTATLSISQSETPRQPASHLGRDTLPGIQSGVQLNQVKRSVCQSVRPQRQGRARQVGEGGRDGTQRGWQQARHTVHTTTRGRAEGAHLAPETPDLQWISTRQPLLPATVHSGFKLDQVRFLCSQVGTRVYVIGRI